MSRPTKNSCDYFPHDVGMRNHKKIKSIRQKFGITGYAIWCMILELLTESDGNVFEDSEIELELISGDFGVSVTEIRLVLDYCYRLELLFLKNGFINSESLDDRLKPVYDKRGRAKEISAKQKRNMGKFSNNTVESVVSVTETPIEPIITVTEKPQSKVKESIVNKSKVNYEFLQNSNLEDIFMRWMKYKEWKGQRYKGQDSVETCFRKLKKLSGENLEVATEIIENAIANNWAGFFGLHGNSNSQIAKKGTETFIQQQQTKFDSALSIMDKLQNNG